RTAAIRFVNSWSGVRLPSPAPDSNSCFLTDSDTSGARDVIARLGPARRCLRCQAVSHAREWHRERHRELLGHRYAFRCPKCGVRPTPDLAPTTAVILSPLPEAPT